MISRTSGIKPSEECLDVFNKIKMQHTNMYAIFRVESEEIIVDKLSASGCQSSELLSSKRIDCLPEKIPGAFCWIHRRSSLLFTLNLRKPGCLRSLHPIVGERKSVVVETKTSYTISS
ncbi:hypothetical protein CSKR_104401 [Clonorchis sinensis]|uniref:ADF-H domain-containing protein n=1 Tax=Clonorchis sinensis TaxID=79923 RepID=A0A419PLI2_CLOSI|nr:hypothetical protein CSKR_104401 [Clonorchis sinensis]